MSNQKDALIGTVVDNRYRLIRKIGDGGMGVVYEAEQVSVDRRIAVKMLHRQLARDPGWVQRFYNEAKTSSLLQHPNTVRMFDFGQTANGQLFLAMEFLDGVSLKDEIWAQTTMKPDRVVRILVQACGSLVEAHAMGIVHRDIKPDNLFLLQVAGTPDFVKVLDFSVAKLMAEGSPKTMAGITFGTPQYMAPEQGRGESIDARTDLYSLGIVAYEMLTGTTPFTGESPMVILQKMAKDPIPPLPQTVPEPLRNLIMKATEKRADNRFTDANDMMLACREVLKALSPQEASQRSAATEAVSAAQSLTSRHRAAASSANIPAASANQNTMFAEVASQGPQAASAQPGLPAVPEHNATQWRATDVVTWIAAVGMGAALGLAVFAAYLNAT